MRVSYQWLREYVDCQLPPAQLAERLTRAGLETEGIEWVGDDAIIELETTSNRPDHLAHLGVAREAAWICESPLRMPASDFPAVERVDGKALADLCSLRVLDRDLCPRYTAWVAVDVEVGPSPEWLRTRLESVGVRSINNVVDLSNFVLFEFGQPLHTFDLDRLQGASIVVRRAAQGERITAINGREYLLTNEDLVIADDARPVAVAGVMGGQDTEVTSRTRRILLESAWFHPVTVRRSSQRLQLSSDASYRFERRVDPAAVDQAARRFLHLLAATTRCKILTGSLEELSPALLQMPAVKIRPARVERLLGVEIPASAIRTGLTALGFQEVTASGVGAAEQTDESLSFHVPSFRGDVTREVDLIEEVARVHGFDAIPESQLAVFPAVESETERLLEAVKVRVIGAGYREALTFSFVEEGPAVNLEQWWSTAAPLEVRNPMRVPERFLRRSLLPNLLQCLRSNRHGGVERIRLFEVARVYHRVAGTQQPRETLHLGWVDNAAETDLRAGRGLADSILDYLGVSPLLWGPLPASAGCLPGAGADLGGRHIGLLGCRRLDGVPEPVWCGEMDLGHLLSLASCERRYRDFSRLPAMQRDLNMVVGEAVTWAQIESEVRELELPDLVALEFTDLYRGRQLPDGHKSLTFSLRFRNVERTLTGEEVDARVQQAVARLEERLSATLRT